MIRVERVYARPPASEGYRILVDRLWPRGIKKTDIDLWLKEVAPSNELREWYGHDPEKWTEFKKRYRSELKAHQAEVDKIREIASKKPVLLLYASKEEKINNAVALKQYLEK
jgi:uncharacterized protein YeaO (DUF488 family)